MYVWKLHDDSNDYNGTFCRALVLIITTKELIIIHLFFNAYRLLIDTNIIMRKSIYDVTNMSLLVNQPDVTTMCRAGVRDAPPLFP